jgi:hypothetical protein
MEKNNKKIAKIFTLEQQFPCGPNSSCCGPIGQSEQEATALKNAIQKLGVDVEIYDVQKIKNLQEHPQVFKLFRTFGSQAIPVITVDNEIACMGQSEVSETVSAIKSKL